MSCGAMLYLTRRTLLSHGGLWEGGYLARGETLRRPGIGRRRGSGWPLVLALGHALRRAARCYAPLLHRDTANCREPAKGNFHPLSNQAKRHRGAYI